MNRRLSEHYRMDAESNVLVAGGTGLIGANLVRRLVKLDVTPRVTYHSKRPVITDDRIEYVHADLTNFESCKKVVEGIDCVFMCAASTSGAATIASNPLIHVTPNIVMNSRMLEASHSEGVRKFVWMSSSVGYPPSGDRPVREEEFFDNDPADVYFASGWMKRYTEILCKMYAEKLEKRMAVVVLRPSNIYGPYDKFDFETSHVTAAMIRKVVERNDPLVVWGNGKDVRDVIYVDDFIDAMLLAAEKIDSFNPLNVAKGEGIAVKELLNTILRIDGYDNARVVYDESKPSMIPKRLIDVRKAENTLGFRAKTSLIDGLSMTIDWYRHNAERRDSRNLRAR